QARGRPLPAVAPWEDTPSWNHHRDYHTAPCHYPPSVRSLLFQRRQGLLDAEYLTRPVERYAQAHLAALRAAAAVLAARARPRRRAQPTSVWRLLAKIAPELAEWSAFFADASAIRAVAEAGAHHLVTVRDADDMVRQASQFLALAQRSVMRALR